MAATVAASERADASARLVGGIHSRKLPVYGRTLGTKELGVRPQQGLDASDEHGHDRQPHQELLPLYGHVSCPGWAVISATPEVASSAMARSPAPVAT